MSKDLFSFSEIRSHELILQECEIKKKGGETKSFSRKNIESRRDQVIQKISKKQCRNRDKKKSMKDIGPLIVVGSYKSPRPCKRNITHPR